MVRSKYGNKKVVNQYGSFDSVKEFERYLVLLDMEKKEEITSLERQVPYEIIPAQYEMKAMQLKTKIKKVKRLKERATYYYADFTYVKDGETIVEDVKASAKFQDDVYRIKKKLMLHVHGITINEVY